MVVFGNEYFKPRILLILSVSIPSQFPAEEGGECAHIDIVLGVIGECECLAVCGVAWFEEGVKPAWVDDGIVLEGFGVRLHGVLLLTAPASDAVLEGTETWSHLVTLGWGGLHGNLVLRFIIINCPPKDNNSLSFLPILAGMGGIILGK